MYSSTSEPGNNEAKGRQPSSSTQTGIGEPPGSPAYFGHTQPGRYTGHAPPGRARGGSASPAGLPTAVGEPPGSPAYFGQAPPGGYRPPRSSRRSTDRQIADTTRNKEG
jgi:hypothetical protein